jgi:threonyl-tRNA synthetase
MTTIQFDFKQCRSALALTYVGADGQDHRPYMVHRALLGSMERLLWGADRALRRRLPAVAGPGAGAHHPYRRPPRGLCRPCAGRLKAAGLRAEVDDGSDRMNAKIRNGQMQRIPYLLVVGDREAEDGAVAVRLRTNENLGAMSVDDFLARAQKLVAERNNTDL